MPILSSESVEDIYHGLVLGFLAITDDKESTLAKVGRVTPWQIEALKLITGNEESAYRPLSEILKEQEGLTLDCHMNVCGITKGGHVLDTQGFIAHNDDTIVLSYRCTSTIFDWLTNFQMTTSVWEVEEDYKQGFSGYFSGLEGLRSRKDRPRVHTGFYNNFLSTLPMIKEHVEPFLRADQPPRRLYVTGYSLGAALATLATCYFLEFFDWNILPHELCSVTAGSPRACGQLMQERVQELIHKFDSSKIKLYRLVKENDAVAALPPRKLGFRHIVPSIVIQKNGSLICTCDGCDVQEESVTTESMRQLMVRVREVRKAETPAASKYERFMSRLPGTIGDQLTAVSPVTTKVETTAVNYEQQLSLIPESIRDHFPDSYLKPVSKARELLRSLR